MRPVLNLDSTPHDSENLGASTLLKHSDRSPTFGLLSMGPRKPPHPHTCFGAVPPYTDPHFAATVYHSTELTARQFLRTDNFFLANMKVLF